MPEELILEKYGTRENEWTFGVSPNKFAYFLIKFWHELLLPKKLTYVYLNWGHPPKNEPGTGFNARSALTLPPRSRSENYKPSLLQQLIAFHSVKIF